MGSEMCIRDRGRGGERDSMGSEIFETMDEGREVEEGQEEEEEYSLDLSG